MSEVFIPYTEREEDALEGLGDHTAEALYRRLRRSMDWRTRTVGRITPISHGGLMLRLKQFTTRGKGVQEHPCTKDVLRSDITKLIAAGLLVRIGNDEALCFLCPMARDASARAPQTPHVPPTHLSTEQTTLKPSAVAGFDALPPTGDFDGKGSNPPYIRDVDVYTPQSSSTGVNEEGVGDAAARGVNRDRPTGSHASSACGRSGNGDETSDRDRAAPSHPAPPRRFVSPARRLAPESHPAQNAPMGVSAAKDLDQPVSGDATTLVSAQAVVLMAAAGRRGVRITMDSEILAEWVRMAVTADELDKAINVAVAYREAAGSEDPIRVKYVHRVIKSQRSKARKAMAGNGGAPEGVEAMARAVGMWPGPAGWSWERLAAEVRQRFGAMNGGQHGAT